MVVMPEYLMTSSKQTPTKPRIISEVKKNCFSKLKLGFATSLQDFGKPKYSGQLLWNTGSSDWVLSAAEVRQGSLILMNKETSAVVLRQPLRELNLRACNAPRTFCLAEAEGIRLLVFQTLSEDEYEKWVRILAAELIRQTPLHHVRFLDILSILRNKEPDKGSLKKGRSEECIAKDKARQPNEPKLAEENGRQSLEKREEAGGDEKAKMRVRYQKSVPVMTERDRRHKILVRAQSMSNLATLSEQSVGKTISDESGISSGEENQVDVGGMRNGEEFSFTSVKERKNFFESLNSEVEAKDRESSVLVRSNSIGNFKQGTHSTPERNSHFRRKRTKSLHDLHKSPVREMCQLFESQERKVGNGGDACERVMQRRLQRQEKKVEKLRKQILEVEETIESVTEDIKSMGAETLRRKEGLEVFAGLQKRLKEEYSKLGRLEGEMSLVMKGNHRTLTRMGRSNTDKGC